MSGILPRIPHFCLLPSSMAVPLVEKLFELRLALLGDMEPLREGVLMLGRSKMCNVDLSDVTASSVLSGDMAMEYTTAGSTPLRNSPMRAQLAVENTRTNVPVWLAVASISPLGLISIALSGVPCAGMMLTFPVAISTICTWPCVRPGKATTFEPRQQRPAELSAVSKTESFSGGDEKAYMCTLFCRTTTIRDLERQTRWT